MIKSEKLIKLIFPIKHFLGKVISFFSLQKQFLSRYSCEDIWWHIEYKKKLPLGGILIFLLNYANSLLLSLPTAWKKYGLLIRMYNKNQLKINIYSVASTSGPHGVTSTRFTLSPEQPKNWWHIHTQNFKATNLRQQRTILPERWETNEVSPTVALVYSALRQFAIRREKSK